MRILLTNDDGFNSYGLQALREALYSLNEGHDVWIVAPDSERSAVSHCITVRDPLRVQKIRDKEFQLGGSPADCVRVALGGLMDVKPDVIVSGINKGPNLGTDIVYSGTAAAARQGALMGVPSLAVSIYNKGQPFKFEALAGMVVRNLAQFVDLWDKDHFININGPNHEFESVKIVVTHPCQRPYSETLHSFDLPNGDRYCFLDGFAKYRGGDPGSDWDTVRNGNISVSPIHLHPEKHRIDRYYENAVFVE